MAVKSKKAERRGEVAADKAKRSQKTSKQKKSKGFGAFRKSAARFFEELFKELKRVVWPTREKLLQSAAVVFAILIAAVIIIGVVDLIMHQGLVALGFNKSRQPVSQAAQPGHSVSVDPSSVPSLSESVEVTPSSQPAQSSAAESETQTQAPTTSASE